MKTFENKMLRWTEDIDQLPRISIVTPCFNHVAFIEATLLSILEQGYPNLEYIVMDGGSTDGSAEIIARYEPYLTYWQSKPDHGQYDAINQGFERTTGEIMAWINSDDMLHRNALWLVAHVFEQLPEVQWLIGVPTLYNENGLTIAAPKYGDFPRWSRLRLLHHNHRFPQQESIFWRRSLWTQAGSYIDPSYQLAGDFDLWIRFSRYAQLYTLSSLVGGFRVSANQKSRLYMNQYIQEVNEILARETLTVDENRTLRWIRFFDRFLPFFIHEFLSIRGIFEGFFDYPPLITYNIQIRKFDLSRSTKRLATIRRLVRTVSFR